MEISKVSINNTDYLLKSVSTQGIPYGDVTSNSTTVFTATVPGITELRQGTCCLIRNNNKQSSESGWTLNVNDLGAKPVYNNMADATRDTTIFNKVYTMLFVYDEDRVDGGCWVCYRGYDSNTNTIGYQLRTNSANMPAVQTGYRYRLWFTDADGAGWVPANTSTATNATTNRALNTRPINPFGPIIYCSHNATKSAGTGLGATYQWSQYALNIGYSYMASGFALVVNAPVYVKCLPQTDGSAAMHSIVSALPTTADGHIYIFLGTAYSTTSLELLPMHPVYYHDGTAIRLWTGASGGSSSVAWNDITGKPTFATVATSGSYNDLSNKPTMVTSFNGNTGAVTYTAPVTSVNGNTGAVTGLQTTSNLVTSISSSSTDAQYPSAKCVYNAIANAGGGGSANVLILYSNGISTPVYIDSAKTTTFNDYYNSDIQAMGDALESYDLIYVYTHKTNNLYTKVLITYINCDDVDESITLKGGTGSNYIWPVV